MTTIDRDPIEALTHTATAYHYTVHDLRRTLAESALHFDNIAEERGAEWHAATDRARGDKTAPPAPQVLGDAYTGALMAHSYAYALAAILGVAGREYGPAVAERLATIADEILTNGDSESLNRDVLSGPTPPPTPAEQEHGGQLRLTGGA